MRKQIVIACIAIAGAFLATSCNKKTTLSGSVANTADQEVRFDQTLGNQLQFDTYQSKLGLSFNDGKKNISVNGTLRLLKDRKMQISLQPFLGIEMFRAEISNDSIKILDRINKRYVAESIAEYRKNIPVDIRFETLQALFMNYIFVPGNETLSNGDFRFFSWRTESDGLLVGRLQDEDRFNLHFFVNPQNFLSQTRVSDSTGKHAVEWNYTLFQPLQTVSFPMRSEVVYRGGEKKISLGITYSKIEIDKPLSLQFTVPASYEKLDLNHLVKSLIK